jgi:hypothetical protein
MADDLIRRLVDARSPSEVVRILADETECMEDDEIAWPTSKALYKLAGDLDDHSVRTDHPSLFEHALLREA